MFKVVKSGQENCGKDWRNFIKMILLDKRTNVIMTLLKTFASDTYFSNTHKPCEGGN